MPEKKNLPVLSDLHYDIQEAFKRDELNLLLHQPPIKGWIKQHPFAKDVKYIPIAKIEFLLTRIFQEWRVEVKMWQPLFNSVAVHIRLHYKNPITGDWSYQDGLGAVPVQTDKGESPSDLSKIKNDAIMKALPAAESYAVKDAAEKLGDLFGKNLNRKDTLAFTDGAYSNDKTISNEQLETITEKIKKAQPDLPKKFFKAYGIDDWAKLPADKYNEAITFIDAYLKKK